MKEDNSDSGTFFLNMKFKKYSKKTRVSRRTMKTAAKFASRSTKAKVIAKKQRSSLVVTNFAADACHPSQGNPVRLAELLLIRKEF